MKYKDMTPERARELLDLVNEQTNARQELMTLTVYAAGSGEKPEGIERRIMDAADHFRRVTHEIGDWLDKDLDE